MHDLRGYTAREIGAMTRQSANTIESRIRRARLKLRKELQPYAAERRIQMPAQAPWLMRGPEFEKRLASESILAVMLHMRRLAG